jgi:hypothetical protein
MREEMKILIGECNHSESEDTFFFLAPEYQLSDTKSIFIYHSVSFIAVKVTFFFH